ncbi:hypothetical protein [Thermoleptolyngbya sp. M55_K2018_002]|uniref:hypothetical protein n=1 Tax=Thermoleptolyngbya sp. M55_K2018_002 TaxID=2747808 RepID=UPI0019F41F0E|nr:hypothetical protein [Thermoleptolyngbya sp. M55_K2018_002]HIK39777.1 hypothetical protein [Thermoleptolyngbya sp. M55_K2018_002]
MQTNSSSQRAECLIIGGLFAASFGLAVGASSATHWLSSFGLWGAGEALRSRRKLEYSEVLKGAFGYTSEAIAEVGETLTPITGGIERKRIQLVSSAIKQLPMGEQLAERYVASQGIKTDWIKEFETGSSAVCGQSKDGKTHLLLWRVQRFLESHPDAVLHICDPDYGSAHEGSEPNTWFRLPLDRVIHADTGTILGAIELVSNEVDRRAKIAQRIAAGDLPERDRPKQPILLVCDEWASFWSELNKDQQAKVVKQLNNITNRGIKQANCAFVLGLHDTAVASTGLPQSLLQRLGVILLYNAGQVEGNYRNLGLSESPDEAIAKLKALPRVMHGVRPCVVARSGSVTLRGIPTLEVADIEVLGYEPPDPTEQWWAEFWTPEVEQAVIARMAQRVSQGKGAIAWYDLADVAGFSRKERTGDSPRYARLKAKLDELASVYDSTPEPPDLGSEEYDFDPSDSGSTQA